MDKLKLAHDYFMRHVNTDQYRHLDDEVLILWSFDYVDAMQAEAEKRVNKERPDALLTKDKDGKCLHFHHEFGHKKCMDCGESLCEVDWRVAPRNAFQWQMINNEAYWRIEIMGGLDTEPAPSFGFTGSHIVERPHGK